MPLRIYRAVFLATLSTTVLPIPEEAALLGAGYVARAGNAEIVPCGGLALLAVLLGDVTSYLVGRLLLARLSRTRIGVRLLPEARRLWAERLVAKRGWQAIVVARFLVGLRGFVYLAVGAGRYPFGPFLGVDVVAGVVEVGGLVAIGFAFGELHGRVGAWVDLIAASILVLALFGPAVVRGLVNPSRAPR